MPDPKEIDQMRVVYEFPDMEHIPVKKDIVYKTVANEDLTMDIYYPFNIQPNTHLPAVIFVQGGASAEQVKQHKVMQQYVSWSQLIAASGLIAVVFEHRSDEGYSKLSIAGEDIDDLCGYVRTHGAKLGINPDFLGIWSCSSGSLYGISAALRGTPEYIRCAIAYYGGMSLMNRKLFHFSSEEEEGAREFSPLYHLNREDAAKIAPLFIAKAGRDRTFLNEALDEFVRMANERNVPITFMNHPDGEHGFDILNDDERSREIIGATLDFVHEHLRV